MSEEIEFLEYIYQNAKMGQESIARLLTTRNKKDDIEKVCKIQLLEYRKISNLAKAMLERRRKKVKEISVMAKIATYMTIKLNTYKDDSKEEVISMLIKGSKIGIEQIKKQINEYKKITKPVLNLAKKLYIIEENNINELEKLLR